MRLLSTFIFALFAKAINLMPLPEVEEYTFRLVGPKPEFSIKVPNQLFIVMCQDLYFGPPCDGGYVAPGLCYATPPFRVTSVQPSQDISGCTLYKSTQCDATEGKLSDVAYPGIADLSEDGLNDQINSFICY